MSVLPGLRPERPALLRLDEWDRPISASDDIVLSHCVGPTLDVGCGPGRLTERLNELGHLCLGIDVHPAAVLATRRRGVPALLRDIFGPTPGEGRWRTALLADGNIGIGGQPTVLLARLRRAIEADGFIVADVEPPGAGVARGTAVVSSGDGDERPIAWATVGADAIGRLAEQVGLQCRVEDVDGRWFAVMQAIA